MLANRYSARSGKSVDEIKKMMDEETWLFADEMSLNHSTDSLIDTKRTTKKSDAIAAARANFAKIRLNDDAAAVAKELANCGLGCNLINFDEGDKMSDDIRAQITKDERKRVSAILALDTLGLDEEKAEEIKRRAISNGASVSDTIVEIHKALSVQMRTEAEIAAQVATGVMTDGLALGQSVGAINTTLDEGGRGNDKDKARATMRDIRMEMLKRRGLR